MRYLIHYHKNDFLWSDSLKSDEPINAIFYNYTPKSLRIVSLGSPYQDLT